MPGFAHFALSALPTHWIKRIAAWQFTVPGLRYAFEFGTRLLRRRDLVIRHGVGSGLRFNACGSNLGYALGTTEPELQRALQTYLKAGATFHDIGACVGFFSVIGARLVGPGGKVCVFEPLPENVRAIEHNLQLNGISEAVVMPVAVSASNGTCQLLLSNNATGSKLDFTGRAPDTCGELAVEVTSLDYQVIERGLPAPDVIKMDIEGAEVEAVTGMRETLLRFRPVVICEMHGRNAEYGRLMRDLGYTVTTLDGVTSVEDAHWNAHTIALPVAGH